jgi:hypothetical protein
VSGKVAFTLNKLNLIQKFLKKSILLQIPATITTNRLNIILNIFKIKILVLFLFFMKIFLFKIYELFI